jgi:integrase
MAHTPEDPASPASLPTLLEGQGHRDRRDRKPVTLRYAVHFGGQKIIKPHKAFRSVRAAAGFSEDVTPHVLRHTRATWMAQAGVDFEQAAASLGMTSEEFERTYSHASPDFQMAAANAF